MTYIYCKSLKLIQYLLKKYIIQDLTLFEYHFLSFLLITYNIYFAKLYIYSLYILPTTQKHIYIQLYTYVSIINTTIRDSSRRIYI